MLELKNIKKNYYVGELVISALKGVTISFRDCEFVSILGQSGCGKTTLMNIIGGLDKSSDGEIFLNGISTKNFKETDWDDYRNQKIGFVFQSYNLISHLNILTNVELALTISGVTGEERTIRAKQALDRVGLKDHYFKRPNQLSGGQMQRVAIARAIVNEPDILLADEPTGAIDSETSVQVMDILKEISKEKLVIMVTHNAELAEEYSTRIIRILDGEIISDNNPIVDDKIELTTEETASDELIVEEITPKDEQPNETEIFAGNQDVQDETVEEINDQTIVENSDENAIENDSSTKNETAKTEPHKKARKHKKGASMSFLTSIKLSFRNLINKRGRSVLTAIAGSIGIISIALILAVNNGFNLYIEDFEKQSMSKYPITISSGEFSVMSTFEEFLGGDDLDSDSLDIGSILNVFTGDSTERQAFTQEELIYVYGQFSGMFKAMQENMSKEKDISKFKHHIENNFDSKLGVVKYDYSVNFNVFKKNSNGVYRQLNPLSQSDTITPLLSLMGGGSDNEDMLAAIGSALDSFAFWDEMVADETTIRNQYDVLCGHLPTNMNEIVIVVDEYNQVTDFDMFVLDELGLVPLVNAMGDQSTLEEFTSAFQDVMAKEFYVMPTSAMYPYNETTKMYNNVKTISNKDQFVEIVEQTGIKLTVSGIIRPKKGVDGGCIKGVVGYTSELGTYIINDANNCDFANAQKVAYEDYVAKITAMAEVTAQLEKDGRTQEELTPDEQKIMMQGLMARLKDLSTGKDLQITKYANLLESVNVRDFEKPAYIYIFPNSIEYKDEISAFLASYNEAQIAEETAAKELAEETGEAPPYVTYVIEYSDDLDSIVNELNGLVNTITYILIAVALVSVLVTMLLIAIVMYISVQDRTREIGILRSLGARKIDISNIFNVETMLLGLASGIIGVVLALILQFPANLIFKSTLGIVGLMKVAWWHAPVLIVGAIIITVISGLIPASIAAKKDPVIALRTE